jgi:aminopeptidase N
MGMNQEAHQPKRIYLKDYQAPSFEILQVQLHFNLAESQTRVKAKLQMKKLVDAPLVLNGENLKLVSVRLNEKALASNDYSVNEKALTIPQVPTDFWLETEVEINPEANKSCEGLYLSAGIFATQCEAESFRKITYFLDRPDVMTSYTVEIEADKKKYPYLLSNGDLISKKDLGNGRHMAVWKDPFKKPSYLFALVAGDMGVIEDSFTTKSGKKVKLEVFAPHGKQARCYHAMESLKKSMKWDEERFGLEYDLNQFMIVSIDDFNMGAMENKGLNIFNSRLVLADPQSATDRDFDLIEAVVGHEYFHNWSGNRVTCRNWFELSLKEGLTVFRDQEFTADLHSRAVERIKAVDALRGSQFAEDAGPNSHPVRPESCLSVDNFYTPTIYEKGAEVIRMMQTIVGRKGFRTGIDEYFKRHDGQAVTILDFADAISQPNKVDFTQFKLWYSQAGTPTVKVTENYDSSKKEYTLTLAQSYPLTEKQPHKNPFHIPLLIGLLDSKGKDMKLNCKDLAFNSDQMPLLHLKTTQQTFVFTDVTEKPVLSINRQFSAPIKLEWNASQAELLHLIKFDSDEFNRREAAYKMLLEELKRLVQAARAGQTLTARDSIVDALGFVLSDSSIDPKFKALMLQLPDEEVLAQEEEILDAEAFHKAYNEIYSSLVKKYKTQLLDLYHKHLVVNNSADRALTSSLLTILVQGHAEGAAALAYKQYTSAKNMTDKLAALRELCQTESVEMKQALDSFYNEWKADAVVFNKWLQVQAASKNKDTFKNTKRLSETAPFSFDTPNNVYSLLTVFGDNYLAMSDASGETYKWLCDQILKIDAKNPQVAARVCGSFNFVKKLPTNLKEKAQAEIRRVLASPSLSRNARELLEGNV